MLDARETTTLTTDELAITAGDCATTLTHSHRGIVTEIHAGCPEGKGWIAVQEVAIRPEALAPDYPWVSILVHNGGSVVAPLHDVRAIETFPVENPYLDEYFTVTVDGRYLPV